MSGSTGNRVAKPCSGFHRSSSSDYECDHRLMRIPSSPVIAVYRPQVRPLLGTCRFSEPEGSSRRRPSITGRFTMIPRLLVRLVKTLLLLLFVLVCLLFQLYTPSVNSPPTSSSAASPAPSPSKPAELETLVGSPVTPTPPGLMAEIHRLNEEQTVRTPGGGPAAPLEPSDVVIVVQVHTRIDYLKQLVASLRASKGIERVMLIFSHDVFDEAVNEEVRKVDFCRVMQIFFPFSLQLHQNSFPGHSRGDCARDMTKAAALKQGCINAMFADKYGHYREARFAQTKHHWWWKANRVFDQLEFTRNHSGLFVFLEEDHYVAPDFLHVLRLMADARAAHCPHCSMLSLGTYMKTYNYKGDTARMEITEWYGSKHNMGMAFNRTTWTTIRSCTSQFCRYDDYNWDWSLQYISQSGCLKRKLTALLAKAPRVFHIGECGVHHRGKQCDKFSLLKRVDATLKSATRYLFPERIAAYLTITRRMKQMKGNGGWADPRDHHLCATGRLPGPEVLKARSSLVGSLARS